MHHTNKAFERYFQVELEDSRKIYQVTQGVKKIGKLIQYKSDSAT